MADGITLNANSSEGALLATDDAGAAGHVQLVKLAIGTDGSATVIPCDATNGLLVLLKAQGGVDLGDVTVNNGDGIASVPVQGAAADGATVAGNPVLVGGSDGTNAQSLLVSSTGALQVSGVTNTVNAAILGTAAVNATILGTPVTNATIVGGTLPTLTAITNTVNTAVLGTVATNATILGTPAVNATVIGTAVTNATIVGGTLPAVTQITNTVLTNATIVGGTLPTLTAITNTVNAAIIGTVATNATILGTPAVNATVIGTAAVNATILGTPAVNATVIGTAAVNATILGTPAVNATVVGGTLTAITNTVTVAGTLTDGGAGKTLKSAVINVTATGNVIAAVASNTLQVYAYAYTTSAANMTVTWRDGATTLLSGPYQLGANPFGVAESVNPPAFLFKTGSGNALAIVVGGTGTVGGRVSYWEETA